MLGSSLLLIGAVLGHMEMSNPAPRRSKYSGKYSGSNIDYSMTAPLDQDRRFPCLGYPKGPSSGTYRAGSSIPVNIIGAAPHNGGHCQFSVSYDGTDFVALQTVYGDCPTASKDFQIQLPSDAPSGEAVFAWTWINRSGNREFYMNCADITIDGAPSGSIRGHEMLIANFPVPGKKSYDFPEGFSNDFGKSYFESTPFLQISPSGTSPAYDVGPVPNTGPVLEEPPAYNTRPANEAVQAPQASPVYDSVSSPVVNPAEQATYPEPAPTIRKKRQTTRNPKQVKITPKLIYTATDCEGKHMACVDSTHFTKCSPGSGLVRFQCPPGTQCKGGPGAMNCS